MNKTKIKQIFLQSNLGKVESITKIEIGYTNEVYSINDKFILKICKDKSNEKNFAREVFFNNYFKDKIPVPNVILYNDSKKVHNRNFMIYHKIQGDNLYSKWHLMTNSQRKEIIRQLCDILRTINAAPCRTFVKRFNLDSSLSWHDEICSKIQSLIRKVRSRKILSPQFLNKISEFVKVNHNVLSEQKIALVYWDVHFDNILVRNDKIVGILDFERTELASIDYVLDTVRKMVDYPKKYISKDLEKFVRKKDYAQLLIWFRDFYPELFEFKNLDRRLDLYSIEYDLDTLLWWPKSRELKQIIAKTVNYREYRGKDSGVKS